jgi:LysM repeat protein
MPVSRPSPYRRHILGTLAVAVAGLAALAARQQGWLGSHGQIDREVAEQRPSRFTRTDDEVPGPLDADELQLPSDAITEEPDSDDGYAGRPPKRTASPIGRNRVRQSQWTSADSPRLELDDGVEDTSPANADSRIATVGFDDDVPAPPDQDDAGTPARKSPADDNQAVARRPTENGKAVSTVRKGEAAVPADVELVDRQAIQKMIDAGNYVDAQHELSRWYWHRPAEREKLLPQLNKMAQALYFSPQPNDYYEPYVVKPGDQLRVVGQRYKLSWEYIAKLNHVDARKIRMGQKLKIVPGPFAAVVSLDRYELVVHLDGSFVKSYRVGVGRDGTTPIGTFAVKNKMVDPTYYGPEGIIPHDDPKNPLGERWIDLGDSYGIHGTIEPDSIGKNESRGCIRMLNSEVEEVYDFLVIGSEVKIQK